jgi:hypothetical protein
MVSFEASSPLAFERWKRFQVVALEALTHAQKHGDARFLLILARAVPLELRACFTNWVRSFSPVTIRQRNGEVTITILKRSDAHYRPYEIERASAAPIFDVRLSTPSPGSQFARQIVAKELEGKSLTECLRVVENWFADRTSRSQMRPILVVSRATDATELSALSHFQLMELYSQTVDWLAADKDDPSERINELRSAIFKEWAERNGRSLVDEYFEWPSTDAPYGCGTLGPIPSPSDGILSAFGYHVGGTNGKPEVVRRLLLGDIFACQLPPMNSRAYMSEWGAPNTPSRLKKTADTLASLCRNEKRRGLVAAPAQREADLEYMYLSYYTGMFGFVWPSADN